MKKLPRKKVEPEIFREYETNLIEILEKKKNSVIEVNLNDDDELVPNFDDVGERINMDKILQELQLSEHKKIDSFQEAIIGIKIENTVNVDTFDVVDISKYIEDNI